MNLVMLSLMAFFSFNLGNIKMPKLYELMPQVTQTQNSVSEDELVQKLDQHRTATLEKNQTSSIENQSNETNNSNTPQPHAKTIEELITEELFRIVLENTTSIVGNDDTPKNIEANASPVDNLRSAPNPDEPSVQSATASNEEDATVQSVVFEKDDTVDDSVPVDEKINNTLSLLNLDPILENVDDMNDEQISILQEDGILEVEEEVAIAEEIVEPAYISNFRQTYYSVEHGEVKVGYGVKYTDEQVQNINNIMHYYDEEYGWIPIVAVNIDEVLATGLDRRGIPNYYGTILEIKYPEGDTVNAIVLDACGACSWDNRIDLWVYSPEVSHDVKGIEYRVIRDGFKEDEDDTGSEVIAADAHTAE